MKNYIITYMRGGLQKERAFQNLTVDDLMRWAKSIKQDNLVSNVEIYDEETYELVSVGE